MRTLTDRHARPVRSVFLCPLLVLAACAGASPPAVTPVTDLPAISGERASRDVDPSGDWDIRWDRGFSGWQPTIFDGRLTIARRGAGWTASLRFQQNGDTHPEFESLQVEGDRFRATFRFTYPGRPLRVDIDARVHDDRLTGEIMTGAPGVPWTPMGGRRHVAAPAMKEAHAAGGLPLADAASVGAHADALEVLVSHANQEHSTAVVLVKEGRIFLERYASDYDLAEPLVAMSGSKSFVSIAVGLLIGDGKLSLDTRMGTLFPEWRKQGAKANVTVRQLLTHTSGLDPSRPDFEKETIADHALAAKLLAPPGTRFQYNNGAVDFLAVVVRRASGTGLDDLLEQRVFRKLGIVGAHWMKDKNGDPRGAGELFIRPVDLAKIGQMMLDGGRWNGEAIVPADWVQRSTEAGQHFDESCGMLWWRQGKFAPILDDSVLGMWREVGVDDKTLGAIRRLRGQKFADMPGYVGALKQAVGDDAVQRIQAAINKSDHVPGMDQGAEGPATGFAAEGWLGQHLVVIPGMRLVAVRMRKPRAADYSDQSESDAYRSFAADAMKAF